MQTELQGLHVDGSSMVTPVAQEHASLAPLCFGSGNKPINEITAIFVVRHTVGFQSMMNVGADRSFFK